MSIYDYKATLENGESYKLDKYKGKIMVIVNTATKCGFAPQFEELEKIYKQFKDSGLVVLGFLQINLSRNLIRVKLLPKLVEQLTG